MNNQSFKKLLFLAPFNPSVVSTESSGLGSQKKIHTILKEFLKNNWQITLVDSSHSICDNRSININILSNSDLNGLIHYQPATLKNRKLGKLFQLFYTYKIYRLLKVERFSVIWLYNGYIFESIMLILMLKISKSKVVLEIEDFPFSRLKFSRLIKDLLDFAGFKIALKFANIVTLVNTTLIKKIPKNKRIILMPGILSSFNRMNCEKLPFQNGTISLGYFGGLNIEKGAGILLEMVPKLPEGVKLIITGQGPLEKYFSSLSQTLPDKIAFYGKVSNEALLNLMSNCDAFLNPHKPLLKNQSGLFPFKIFEYLSFARPIITTSLPDCGVDIQSSIIEVSQNSNSILIAIDKLNEHWNKNREKIIYTSKQIRDKFSSEYVYTQFINLYNS